MDNWQTPRRQSLAADIVQSCGLERATGAVDAALQCIIQMSASPALQVPGNRCQEHQISQSTHGKQMHVPRTGTAFLQGCLRFRP